MNQTVRASLPAVNALTEDNIFQYAIYADSDNVLIKEKERGIIEVANNSTQVLNHNLGYIPLVLIYAQVGANRILLTGSDLTSTYEINLNVGIETISITNNAGSNATVKYFIFYDDQILGKNINIPIKSPLIAITKDGYNVLKETNPNNFIFRSDLNTFKIIKTGSVFFTVSGSSTEVKTTPHGLTYIPGCFAFARKNGSTIVIGPSQFRLGVATDNYKLFSVWADSVNLNFEIRNDNGGSMNIEIRYYCFEIPV